MTRKGKTVALLHFMQNNATHYGQTLELQSEMHVINNYWMDFGTNWNEEKLALTLPSNSCRTYLWFWYNCSQPLHNVVLHFCQLPASPGVQFTKIFFFFFFFFFVKILNPSLSLSFYLTYIQVAKGLQTMHMSSSRCQNWPLPKVGLYFT